MRRESSEMHVARLAATQHGVVTTAQLAAAGIGRRAVAHRVAQGWMRRVHRGVYLLGPVEPPLAAAMGAVRKGIHVHITASLPQSEVRRHHRLPLTSPERTLLDLAATLPDRDLERAVEEAQVLRLLTHRSLDEAIERHRGRRGIERLRAARDRHATPAMTRSEAERLLLDLIRAADLPEPRTNVRVGPYEVDMRQLRSPPHAVIARLAAALATRAA